MRCELGLLQNQLKCHCRRQVGDDTLCLHLYLSRQHQNVQYGNDYFRRKTTDMNRVCGCAPQYSLSLSTIPSGSLRYRREISRYVTKKGTENASSEGGHKSDTNPQNDASSSTTKKLHKVTGECE